MRDRNPRNRRHAPPPPRRGGAGGGALRAAFQVAGACATLTWRAVLVGWRWVSLWRETLYPVLVFFPVAYALLIAARPLPGPFALVLALGGAALAATPPVRAGWTRTGRESVRARRAYARILREVRDTWDGKMKALRLVTVHDAVPHIVSSKVSDIGIRLRLSVPDGLEVADLRSRQGKISAAFSCRYAAVTPGDAGNTRIVDVLLAKVDPLDRDLGLWPVFGEPDENGRADLTNLPARTVTDPTPVGVDEEGTVVSATMDQNNLLIGGIPGWGKSVALQQFVAAFALCPPENAKLYLGDPKLVDLGRWKDRATVYVGTDEQDKMLALLDYLEDQMKAALRVMEAAGVDNYDKAGLCAHLLVIDEMTEYTADTDDAVRLRFTKKLASLVRRGRAAGFQVILATQRPTSDTLPTSISSLFSLRLAMKVTGDNTKNILGDGVYGDASDIQTKGVGLYKAGAAAEAVRLRTYFLSPEDLAALVTAAGTADKADLGPYLTQPGTGRGARGTGRTTPPAQAPQPAAQAPQPGTPAAPAPAPVPADDGVLVLVPGEVSVTAKVVPHLAKLEPGVVDEVTARATLLLHLYPLAGTRVEPSTRHGHPHPAFWVDAPGYAVKLDRHHRVTAVQAAA